MDNLMVAQGEGYIRRYIELDIEAGKANGEQALEWFAIIENALATYRQRIGVLENKIAFVAQELNRP